MDINDLDDGELNCLAPWLAAAPLSSGPIDLGRASAWRFAQARISVEKGQASSFPDIGE